MARRAANEQLDAGPSVPGAELEYIPIDELTFDATNPRVAELVGDSATQRQIRDLLVEEMEARELVSSFMANGYLPYQPLVVRPKRRGRYLVLEGNRRLAALLSMRDSEDEEEQTAFREKGLNHVPCLIFQGESQQELAYLGLRHLSKTKDWSSASKAAFVERMLSAGQSLSEAARLTNTTPQALRLLLLTRRLFERAIELGIQMPSAGAPGDVIFWHLGDAVRRRNTRQYLQIQEGENPLDQPEVNESRFENLVGWLYGNPKTGQDRLIRSIRDIPAIDNCLGQRVSTEALERGASIEEAREEAQAAGYTVKARLDRARKSVQRATAGVSDVEEDGRKEVEGSRAALGKAIDTFDKAFAPDDPE